MHIKTERLSLFPLFSSLVLLLSFVLSVVSYLSPPVLLFPPRCSASEREVTGLLVDSGALCASANQQSASAAGEQRELLDRFHAVSRAALLGWQSAADRQRERPECVYRRE